MRKISAGVLAVFFLFFSSGAFAFVPLLLASTRLGSIVMGTTTGQQIAISSALAVGTAITYLKPTRTDSASTLRDDPIYLMSTPRPLTVDESSAGWTVAASGVQPTPPASLPVTNSAIYRTANNLNLGGTYTSNLNESCSQLFSNLWGGFVPTNVYTESPVAGYASNYSKCFGTHPSIGTNVSPGGLYLVQNTTCPAGYSVNGSSCVLSNAAAVVKPADGQCSIVRTGNSYAADSLDPDCADGHAPTISSNAAGSTVSYTGADGSSFVGNYTAADGKQSFIYTVPNIATNTTEQTTVNLDPPLVPGQAPTISGVKKETLSGVGSAASATPLSQSVTVNDGSAAAAQAIIAAQAADSATVPVATSSATLDTALAARAAVPAEIAAIQTGVDPVAAPSLFQPFTPAECVPLGFAFHGYEVSLNPCPWVPTIRNIFAWVLYLITAGLLFSMFTRKPESAG